MPTASPMDLAQRLQQLLGEREQHADTLARIDAALDQIRSALQAVGGLNGKGGRAGRPAASVAAPSGPAVPARRRRGRRGSYATTADEMILGLVRQKGGATTKEIKAKWKEEGRGGTADNALSHLVKNKKLKRTPLQGERGSRFTLP